MTSHLLTLEQAKALPIGTVLFFVDTVRKKEENRIAL